MAALDSTFAELFLRFGLAGSDTLRRNFIEDSLLAIGRSFQHAYHEARLRIKTVKAFAVEESLVMLVFSEDRDLS